MILALIDAESGPVVPVLYNLCQVSRTWWQRIIRTPHFWTSVHVDHWPAAALCLKKSKDLSLDIVLQYCSPHHANSLLATDHRWRSFRIPNYKGRFASCWASALGKALPRLQEIDVNEVRQTHEYIQIAGGPELRELRVNDVSGVQLLPSSGFTKLVHLNLSQTKLRSINELVEAIQAAAEHLETVQIASLVCEPDGGDRVLGTAITMPRLRSLVLLKCDLSLGRILIARVKPVLLDHLECTTFEDRTWNGQGNGNDGISRAAIATAIAQGFHDLILSRRQPGVVERFMARVQCLTLEGDYTSDNFKITDNAEGSYAMVCGRHISVAFLQHLQLIGSGLNSRLWVELHVEVITSTSNLAQLASTLLYNPFVERIHLKYEVIDKPEEAIQLLLLGPGVRCPNLNHLVINLRRESPLVFPALGEVVNQVKVSRKETLGVDCTVIVKRQWGYPEPGTYEYVLGSGWVTRDQPI